MVLDFQLIIKYKISKPTSYHSLKVPWLSQEYLPDNGYINLDSMIDWLWKKKKKNKWKRQNKLHCKCKSQAYSIKKLGFQMCSDLSTLPPQFWILYQKALWPTSCIILTLNLELYDACDIVFVYRQRPRPFPKIDGLNYM